VIEELARPGLTAFEDFEKSLNPCRFPSALALELSFMIFRVSSHPNLPDGVFWVYAIRSVRFALPRTAAISALPTISERLFAFRCLGIHVLLLCYQLPEAVHGLRTA
jgi:hypothetical protein